MKLIMKSGEKIKEIICEILADPSLTITGQITQTTPKAVKYLDVTLNLANGKKYRHRTPDKRPLYDRA